MSILSHSEHSPARQSFNGIEKSKYTVMKNRDPHNKHVNCQYFVLDPQHDLNALLSLVHYRDTILNNLADNPTHAELAADLMVWINGLYRDFWPNEKNLLSWTTSHSCNLVDVETTGLLPDPTPKTQHVPSEEWMDEQAFEDYIAQLRNARWDAIRAKKAAEGNEHYMSKNPEPEPEPELLTDRFAAARAKTGYWDVVRAKHDRLHQEEMAKLEKPEKPEPQPLDPNTPRDHEYDSLDNCTLCGYAHVGRHSYRYATPCPGSPPKPRGLTPLPHPDYQPNKPQPPVEGNAYLESLREKNEQLNQQELAAAALRRRRDYR